MTGRSGKWPWKYHSVAVTAFSPRMYWRAGSYSTIRSTIRIGQRCGISFWISAVDRTTPSRCSGLSALPVPWAAGGVGDVSTPIRSVAGASVKKASWHSHRSGRGRRVQERGAADPVEQIGCEFSAEEGFVLQQGSMQRQVRHQTVNNYLVECVARASDRLVPVTAPDN